jgi:hypothetical protein
MQSIIFYLAIVGMAVIVVWCLRNDTVGPKGRTRGILALRERRTPDKPATRRGARLWQRALGGRLRRPPALLLVAVLAFAAGWPGSPGAQALPSGSALSGDLRRDAEGHLVVVPPSESAPSSAPTPSAVVAPATQPHAAAARPVPAKPAAIQVPAGPPPPPTAAPPSPAVRSAARPPSSCLQPSVTCLEVMQAGTPSDLQPLTFGQAFARGDVPSGSTLAARDEAGHDLALQIDQRSTFADGSLRFAVLSTEIPGMAAGERRQVALSRVAKSAPPALPPGEVTGGIKEIRVDLVVARQTAAEPSRHYSAVVGTSTPPRSTWLNGPVAVERVYAVPLLSDGGDPHPHLTVRVYWRRYLRSAADRADVVVENDWTFQPGPRDWTYDVTIQRDGTTVVAHKGVPHYQHGRWHAVVWSAGRSEPGVAENTRYLLRSGAVPHYDETLTIPDGVLARDAQKLAAADTGPMGTAMVATYMPSTGGRPDIGPLPRWAAIALLTMDRRALAVLFANAEAGAGVPIHFRDKSTDLPVSLDDHPRLALLYGHALLTEALPAVVSTATPWTPDSAHHPSLSYLPFLLTGDLFYLEEVQFWANWVMGSVDPLYRLGSRGLVSSNQVRGQAWALRTLGEAATITPDGHPLKRYFVEKLADNMTWYVEHYPRNANAEKAPRLGFIEKPDQPGVMGPWQQDFLFLAVGHLWELGVPGAEEFARWLARFDVGRWTSDSAGYCHTAAPAYYITVRRKSNNTIIDTWADLYRENWPSAGGICPAAFVGGYPNAPDGYVANAYAMLGLAADMTVPGALEAQHRLRAEAPGMLAAFSEDPTFDIVPRQ